MKGFREAQSAYDAMEHPDYYLEPEPELEDEGECPSHYDVDDRIGGES